MTYRQFLIGWAVVILLISSMLYASSAHAFSFSLDPACYNDDTLTDPLHIAFVPDNDTPHIYTFYGDGSEPSAPIQANVYDITGSSLTSPIDIEILSFDFMRAVFVDYTSEEFVTHGDAVYTLWASVSDQSSYEAFISYLDSNGLQPAIADSVFDAECETGGEEPVATTTPEEIASLNELGRLLAGVAITLLPLILLGLAVRGMRRENV